MFQRQLPSGKPAHPDSPPLPHRQVFVAHPGKGNIIDLEPESPPPAPPNPVISRARVSRPAASRRGPLPPEEVFPAEFAARYEQYREEQEHRPWGFHVDQDNPDQIYVTFYGSRWTLLLLFFANILIGFSLEKVPDFVPKILDWFL